MEDGGRKERRWKKSRREGVGTEEGRKSEKEEGREL